MTASEPGGDAEGRASDNNKSGGDVIESDVAVISLVPLRRDFRLLALPAIQGGSGGDTFAQGWVSQIRRLMQSQDHSQACVTALHKQQVMSR